MMFTKEDNRNNDKKTLSDSSNDQSKQDGRQPLLAVKDNKSRPCDFQTNLMDVSESDRLFIRASILSVGVWMVCVLFVYGVTPVENFEYLPRPEREVAILAFSLLLVVLLLIVIQAMLRSEKTLSGIFIAAFTVQIIAIITNAMLAFSPTVVMIDPVTKARVFLLRWCEWIPLAGFMTFLAEAVDMPKDKKGIRLSVWSSLTQSISTGCGLIFPFCPGPTSWSIVLFVSVVNYLAIFPRVYQKRKALSSTTRGASLGQSEYYDRLSFAYYLVLACAIIWSVLVMFYFANIVFIRTLPEDHPLRNESLAMILDTVFDVVAKAVYMKLIVDVHRTVFDASGRARRQLLELRRLMSAVWDSVSDVIVITVRHEGKITTMFSPSFKTLVGGELPKDINNGQASALLVETIAGQDVSKSPSVTSAYVIDSYEMPTLDEHQVLAKLVDVPLDSPLVKQGNRVAATAWNSFNPLISKQPLVLFQVNRTDGVDAHCEITVSRHSNNYLIAVVRDVTERHLRFEADRRAHAETLARQRDAHAINRFTRHEVKNGLLAGIELCDRLKSSFADIRASLLRQDRVFTTAEINASMCIRDLHAQLYDTLDTVLAEALARDVVHEVYLPRIERVDLKEVFTNSFGATTGKSEMFPLELNPREMPILLLDQQLIRYIHRNAVSNACKYGKFHGTVRTVVFYDESKEELRMDVINEPGQGHEELVLLGKDVNEIVFTEGKTLHAHLGSPDRRISSGDGAWIMQKCARTMKGECNIRFEKRQTIFSFTCPAKPLQYTEWSFVENFELPPGTWGIAIDDSRIQRQLMSHIFSQLGVSLSRQVIIGEYPSEVEDFGIRLITLLEDYPNSKFLVLVDENLDYQRVKEHMVLSGSVIMNEILRELEAQHASRVCVLVRSANDSANDMTLYLQRSHGFFPKAPMQKQRVQEIVAPLWAARFPDSDSGRTDEKRSSSNGCLSEEEENEDFIALDELIPLVKRVDDAIASMDHDLDWGMVWGVLHALKGDLMVAEKSKLLDSAINKIVAMRGSDCPPDLAVRWNETRNLIIRALGINLD